ncbi:MAG: tyrosine--tRNA ligase [Pseudomonadales bacterium]|nr:tyrosine--tRNA ligase [Pseudomonadales bacterium]
MSTNALLNELAERGLIQQQTGEAGELETHLNSPRSLYCGFDPTADSLHIGSLVPLLTLKRFQLAGHRPIALVGGATGLIGDPSFKAQERQLNTADTVAGWVQRLTAQVSQFIHFEGDNAAQVVNNLDWTADMSTLDFLRDVGKYFSVNAMIQKESVKQRIEREGSGISFTEFTYMLLQSFDFAELYQRHECTLQIGGSDQWGNITGGTELTRRMHGGKAFGLTLPLVTKADGTKFGKTESGTIWLDSKKTSPYAFYQFWLNTADADVYKFLKYFTFLSVAEINAIEQADQARQGRPEAQAILAREVTQLVHGEAGLAAAMRISEALFSGDQAALSQDDFEQLKQDGLPATNLNDFALSEISLVQLLTDSGMAKSGKQVKDALARDAVLINGEAKGLADNMSTEAAFDRSQAKYQGYFLVKLGKKNWQLFYC